MKPSIHLKFTIIAYFIFSSLHLFSQTKGNIEIISIPSGAVVFINDSSTNKVTPLTLELMPGDYNLKLEKTRFETYYGVLNIREGEMGKTEYNLIPSAGVVKISTNPDNADIYIDGIYKGKSPIFVFDLISGNHTVEIRKEMYTPYMTSFTLEPDQSADLVYDLAAQFATIGILALPEADIYIDGEIVGNRIFSGRITPGTHTVEVSKKNFVSQTKIIEVLKGDEFKLSFNLDKLYGKISLSSDPQGAKVYLNKKLIGLSPIYIDSLDMGEYDVMVVKDDYKPWSQTIQINSGATLPLNAVLLWGEKVTIISTPVETEGADVFVNGELKGKTPLDTRLLSGTYKVELKKRAWDFFSSDLEIMGDRYVSYNMVQSPFNLNISTIPKNAKIKLDGKEIGKTPLVIYSLKSGDKQISVSRRGYKPIDEYIFIEKENPNLNFYLEPLAKRSKGEALILSLIFPGAGQSYLNRTGGGVIFAFLGYGCLAGHLYSQDQIEKFRGEPSENTWIKNSEYFLYGAAGIWGLNFLITLGTPGDKDRLKRYNMTARVNPIYEGAELGLNINW